MHESSLARSLLEVVIDEAHARGARRVVLVRGRIEDPERIDPAGFALLFEGAARGTIAEGARVELAWIAVPARCRTCGREFVPESHHVVVCPCGSLDAALVRPTGVTLDAIEVDA
jgi:hydrogenase nickel incorporation protein HypA/HybF